MDSKYHSEDIEEAEKQIKAFFNLPLKQPELHAVEREVLEFARFEKEREELGINPWLSADEELKRLQKLNAKWAKENEEQRARNAEFVKSSVAQPGKDAHVHTASKAEPVKACLHWPLITICAVSLVCLASRNWRK